MMAEQNRFEPKFALEKVEKDLIASLNKFLARVLAETSIEGILVQQSLPTGVGFVPALSTDAASLEHANPIAPMMPVNASKAVSDYSRLKPSFRKVAVVLRPCEARALVELVKLKQANIENIVVIGVDCPGTYPIQALAEARESKSKKETIVLDSSELINNYTKPGKNEKLRSACIACEHFAPGAVDILIGLYGLDIKKQFLVGANTTVGEDILEPLKLKFDAADAKTATKKRAEAIERIKAQRMEITLDLERAIGERIHGLDNFMTELSACINCHNCMTVCPICYCKECFFESPTFDLEPEKYFKMATQKGSLRLPANTFLFHVSRFNHMVLSCIACGMCEQGCPANIPLLAIYKTVGRNATGVFEYEPGRALDEDIPILTFKEEELEPRT
jgi:formate dehydrogenase subunit beta